MLFGVASIIGKSDGVYEIIVSITVNSGTGPGALYGFSLYLNSGGTEQAMFHAHENLAGGGGEHSPVGLSGQQEFSSGDKIELYVWNETNATNIIFSDCTISVKSLRSLC